jgi:hypothetical protein
MANMCALGVDDWRFAQFVWCWYEGKPSRRGKLLSGIVCWVDFERDVTRERATAVAMTAAMDRRGPDDGGVWLARHAALGHRRLAVIDIEGGRQPVAAEILAVVTFSGEIYNFRELRAGTPGRATYKGMHELRPSHLLRVGRTSAPPRRPRVCSTSPAT